MLNYILKSCKRVQIDHLSDHLTDHLIYKLKNRGEIDQITIEHKKSHLKG